MPPRPSARPRWIFKLFLPAVLLVLAATLYLLLATGGYTRRSGLLVVNLKGCKGFAELRQALGLAIVASRLSQRCLVLSGQETQAAANPAGDALEDTFWDQKLLGKCVQHMQGCLGDPSQWTLTKSFIVVETYEQLMAAEDKQVSWKCSKLESSNARDSESSFWKAINCLDASQSAKLAAAAKTLHGVFDKSFNMILGAASMTQQGIAQSNQECRVVPCEYRVGSGNLAEHLLHKGILNSTQLVLADHVDSAAEGMCATICSIQALLLKPLSKVHALL